MAVPGLVDQHRLTEISSDRTLEDLSGMKGDRDGWWDSTSYTYIALTMD